MSLSRWAIIAVVAVLAVLLFASWSRNGGQPVEAAKITRGTLRETVEDRGKTRLPRTWNITMPFAGRIETLAHLPEQTPVKKEQLLTQVVPRDLTLRWDAVNAAKSRIEAAIVENNNVSVELVTKQQAEEFVRSMESTVAAAVNRLDAGMAKFNYAAKNLQRITELWRGKSKTDDDYEQSQLQYVQSDVDYKQDKLVLASLQAMLAATKLMPVALDSYMDRKKGDSAKVLERQLEELKVQLLEVERDVARGKLLSPIDGIVLERAVVDEQYLAAGSMLLKLGDLSELEVEVDILSQDVVHVRVGQPAEIFGPAIGPQPARGVVQRIYPAGFTKVSSLGVEQQRVKVIVRFAPDELERLRKERELGVDYRVRVRIITREKADLRIVPRTALFHGADGKWSVFAVRDGYAKQIPVGLGIVTDEAAELVAGDLQAEELVILAPESSLTDQSRVTATVRETAPIELPATGD